MTCSALGDLFSAFTFQGPILDRPGETPTPGRRDPDRSGGGFPRGRADHDRGECVVDLRPGLAKLERERLAETLAQGPQERFTDLVVVILANAVAGVSSTEAFDGRA